MSSVTRTFLKDDGSHALVARIHPQESRVGAKRRNGLQGRAAQSAPAPAVAETVMCAGQFTFALNPSFYLTFFFLSPSRCWALGSTQEIRHSPGLSFRISQGRTEWRMAHWTWSSVPLAEHTGQARKAGAEGASREVLRRSSWVSRLRAQVMAPVPKGARNRCGSCCQARVPCPGAKPGSFASGYFVSRISKSVPSVQGAETRSPPELPQQSCAVSPPPRP